MIENDAQKILKIFCNRLKNPERAVYKIHEHPCQEPLKGKPVYEDVKPVYEDVKPVYDDKPKYKVSEHESEFPTMGEEKGKYDFESQKERRKYQEKSTSRYILEGISKESYIHEFLE